MRSISVDALANSLALQDPPIVIDVREWEEFNGPLGHLDHAILIPVGKLPHRLGELEEIQSRTIVTVCRSGARSVTAAAILTLAGFPNVSSLEGGMVRWRERQQARELSSLWVG